MADVSASNYIYRNAGHSHAHDYLLPTILRLLEDQGCQSARRRIFELGCGNGSTASTLEENNFEVVGVDPSIEGISRANTAYPNINLNIGDCYSDLVQSYGQFPIVLSLEVIEHVFLPRDFAQSAYALLEDGGIAIISTPFHGYWKNIALALSGKMDEHYTALWDYGHIKFWSEKTLAQLLLNQGFKSVRFERVGRIRALAKSMIAVAQK
jgi:2-polyprenyl-3-methyl-5-hydroxy-6-metoxy-1,4-benzoquinol methylase